MLHGFFRRWNGFVFGILVVWTRQARISIEPAAYRSKPCVRGQRYPVETLQELLSSSKTIEEILADYPSLGVTTT